MKTTNVNKKLLDSVWEKFKEKLQAKTSWGRNDVIAIYKEAVNEAVLEMLAES